MDACGPVLMQPSQEAAYRKALATVIRAHDKVGSVKTAGWTQAWILREVFNDLEEAAEALIELNPNAVSKDLRVTVNGWTG